MNKQQREHAFEIFSKIILGTVSEDGLREEYRQHLKRVKEDLVNEAFNAECMLAAVGPSAKVDIEKLTMQIFRSGWKLYLHGYQLGKEDAYGFTI